MNHLQDPVHTSSSPRPSTSSAQLANRPFTRTLNVLYDRVKPTLYHKVDRSVLDVVVRRGEGFRRTWVAFTIPELALAAAISLSSASAGLKRLTEAGIITRRKRKLTRAGRYIWEVALTEGYRVDAGVGPAADMSPSPSEPAREVPEITPALESEPQCSAAALAPDEKSADQPASLPCELVELPTLPVEIASPAPPLAAPAQPPACADVPKRPEKKITLTPEQTQSQMLLSEVGIDFWKACKLARSQPPELIHLVVHRLKHRVGTVRNPAAWIVRELERGGYAPPAAELAQAQRLAEQEAQAQRLRETQELQAQAAQAEETATQRLLEHFRELPLERQRELEERTRQALRRISPRLAQAALELDTPGPMRSQLLELLQASSRGELDGGAAQGARVQGPTPRRGGFERGRGTAAVGRQVVDS